MCLSHGICQARPLRPLQDRTSSYKRSREKAPHISLILNQPTFESAFSPTFKSAFSPTFKTTSDISLGSISMQNYIACAVFIVSVFSAAESFQWTSVPRTELGQSKLGQVTTESFVIPAVIPDSARDVLIFASVSSGYSGKASYDEVKIFTQRGSKHYEQYLGVATWTQSAINTNSDNMWFPMPNNRRVYVTVPKAFGGPGTTFRIAVVGYTTKKN